MCEAGPPTGASHVVGRRALAFAARQREGRLALGLREPAGELGEGLDERGAFGDAHLPQLHLLAPSPLLRRLGVHLPVLPQVALVAQDDNCDLRRQKTLMNLLCGCNTSINGSQNSAPRHLAVVHNTRNKLEILQTCLFLVPGLVYFLLDHVDPPERLQAVDAVDQHEAVRHRVVVFGQVLAIVEPFGVVQPELLLHTAVSLHRGHVHVLLGVGRLGA